MIHGEIKGESLILICQCHDFLSGVRCPVIIMLAAVTLYCEHDFPVHTGFCIEGKPVGLTFFQADSALFKLDMPCLRAGIFNGKIRRVVFGKAVHNPAYVIRRIRIGFKTGKAGKARTILSAIAMLCLLGAIIYDTVAIFGVLQNPETGEFNFAAITTANWPVIGIVTGCAVVIAAVLLIISTVSANRSNANSSKI